MDDTNKLLILNTNKFIRLLFLIQQFIISYSKIIVKTTVTKVPIFWLFLNNDLLFDESNYKMLNTKSININSNDLLYLSTLNLFYKYFGLPPGIAMQRFNDEYHRKYIKKN